MSGVESKFVAFDVKATYRPSEDTASALSVPSGPDASSPNDPSFATLTSETTPEVSERENTSERPFGSPEIAFVAALAKMRVEPSEAQAATVLAAFSSLLLAPALTRVSEVDWARVSDEAIAKSKPSGRQR